MATEHDVRDILDYHEATNHTVESVRAHNHRLDFSLLPRLYKLYRRADPIPLPEDMGRSSMPALAAIASGADATGGAAAPSLADAAALLRLSAGVTKRLRMANGGHMDFRAASCTGALYHIELYLVCGDLDGLPAGVYHYGVHDDALRRLREGDWRGALTDAAAGHPSVASAPLAIVGTSVFWRNAWKYQSRAYRHAYWDCGTILANTLALASARGLPAQVVTAFADDAVNALVDVDGAREAAVAVVAVGAGRAAPDDTAIAPPPLHLETLPYSPREVDYPDIRAAHAATSLDAGGVTAWRALAPIAPPPAPAGAAAVGGATETVEQVILRRGSTRRFAQTPISADALERMLAAAQAPVPGDWPALPAGMPLNDLYLIVNGVEDVPPGAYHVSADGGALTRLRAGEARFAAGHLGLDQELAHDAAVNAYFLTDLGAVTDAMGARGYRTAQLDASIRAGRLYLSAYALGLGATGLTFYDDEVVDYFAPHAADKSVMFLTLLGVPRKRSAAG